ncbi:XRE family transcriptional regulator (plasmid) [Clostridium botulinum C/D str. BKT12695]|nr:XRE family transcriptional regulator [Clostridium botulinum C/D str. BKT12695]
MAIVHERIKKERIEKGINQPELAKILNVSKQTVSNWENGKRTPDADTLTKLADFFNCSVDYLLGKTDILSPNSTIQNAINKSSTLELLKKLIDEHVIKEPEDVTNIQLNDLIDMLKNDAQELLNSKYKK